MEPFRPIHTFSVRAAAALAFAVSLLIFAASDRGGTNPPGAAAEVIDLSTGCAPGSLPAPPALDATGGEAEGAGCAPVADKRAESEAPVTPAEPAGHFATLASDGGDFGVSSDPIPNPGNFVAGTFYNNGTLSVTESATFSSYMEVYPRYIPHEFLPYSDGAFITATNRTLFGVEFLARYGFDAAGQPHDPTLEIFDWSCAVEGYPCDGPSAFVRTWRILDQPCWHKMLQDNTNHFVNYVYSQNSSSIVEPRNPPLDPPLWRNAVFIWNYCNSTYENVYSHDFAVNQPDCGAPGPECAVGFWAGGVEMFTYDSPELKPPSIVKMGFHHQTLTHDGISEPLETSNSNFKDPSTFEEPFWNLYALFPNSTWEVGTYQDDDGDTIPNDSDPDIDGDGIANGVEVPCGTTAQFGRIPEWHPYRFPERRDGAYLGRDDDADDEVDEAIPYVPNEDCDGDGFTGLIEQYVFSSAGNEDDQYACGETSTSNDEANDRWPADFDDNRVINIGDVLALKAYFGLEVPPAPVRYDIALGGSINIGDVLAINPVFGRVCATPP